MTNACLVRSDPPGAPWVDERAVALVRNLVQAFNHLRSQSTDIGPGSVEVVFTEDLTATVRALDSETVSDMPANDYHRDRVGGTVMAKTMYRNADRSSSVIVIDAVLVQDPHDLSRIREIFVIAHELAHALVGQLRWALGVVPMEPSWLPWETSRWLTRYALEEYQADRLAQVILSVMGTVDASGGEPRPFRSRDCGSCIEPFVAAAGQTVIDIAELVHSYRLRQVSLDSMWPRVQTLTSELLIALAHAQAEADETEFSVVVTELVTEHVSPMVRLWAGMTPIVRNLNVLTSAAEFAFAERQALDAGRDVLLAFWATLGLSFTPQGDTFYLAVAPPDLAWRPTS